MALRGAAHSVAPEADRAPPGCADPVVVAVDSVSPWVADLGLAGAADLLLREADSGAVWELAEVAEGSVAAEVVAVVTDETD